MACDPVTGKQVSLTWARFRPPERRDNTELSGEGPRPSARTSSAPILCSAASSMRRLLNRDAASFRKGDSALRLTSRQKHVQLTTADYRRPTNVCQF